MTDERQDVVLGDLLSQVKPTVEVSTLGAVRFAGVRWYAAGVYDRVEVKAADVKTKIMFRLAVDDVTYNRMWATKAAFGVAGPEVDGCLVTNDFPIFRCNQHVRPAYLALLFETPAFQAQASALAVGTTERRRLKERDFLKIRVPLPSVDAQDRIIDLMRAVTLDVATAERVTDAATRLAASVLAEVEDESDEFVTLAQVVAQAKAGGTPSRAIAANFGGDVGWLKSGEVPYDNITSTSECITAEGLASSSAWLMPAGSIVVAMYGQGATAGSVGWLGASMTCNQAVLGLVPDPEKVHPRFLFHWLRSRKESMRSRRVGTSQPNLNKEIVLQEPVPVLSLQRQVALAAVLDEAGRLGQAAVDAVTALWRLRTGLLSELTTGLRPIPVTYDALLEPA